MEKLQVLRDAGVTAGIATLLERKRRGELSAGVAAAAERDVVRVEGLSQELPLGAALLADNGERCDPVPAHHLTWTDAFVPSADASLYFVCASGPSRKAHAGMAPRLRLRLRCAGWR